MDFDLDRGLKLLNAAAMVGSIALNIYLYFKAKTDDRFAEVHEALEDFKACLDSETQMRVKLDRSLVKLETEFQSAPKHDDLNPIKKALAELGADVSTVKERSMNSLQSLRRIEQHLLERSK